MTLEAIYQVSEIIAAIAVIGSLVFVGTQLRQNTRAIRISAGQAMVMTWGETNRDLFENEHLAPLLAEGLTGSKDDDAINALRLSFWFGNAIRQGEFNYYNWKAGDLDERYWQQTDRALARAFQSDALRNVWEAQRNLYSDEFVALMDKHAAAGSTASKKPYSTVNQVED